MAVRSETGGPEAPALPPLAQPVSHDAGSARFVDGFSGDAFSSRGSIRSATIGFSVFRWNGHIRFWFPPCRIVEDRARRLSAHRRSLIHHSSDNAIDRLFRLFLGRDEVHVFVKADMAVASH